MINYNIRIKRATSSRWNSINPILSAGELGLETDTGKIKAGNGAASWSELNYIGPDNTNLLIPTRNYYGYIGSGYWDDLSNWVTFDANNGQTLLDGINATQLPTENDYVVIHGQISGAKDFIKVYHVTLESYIEDVSPYLISSSIAGLTLNCDTFICDSTAYDIDTNNTVSCSSFIYNGTIINATTCYFMGMGEGGNGGMVNADNTYISDYSLNTGIINGNVIFDGYSTNYGVINGNAQFFTESTALGQINGNAIFHDSTYNMAIVTNNAIFLGSAANDGNVGTFEPYGAYCTGAATFFNSSSNNSIIDGYAFYYDNSINNTE